MKKMFCEYCGTSLKEGCKCHLAIEEEIKDFYDEYDNGLDVLEGLHQQDIIDAYRRER